MTGLVLGVDACRTGWVGVSLSGDDIRGWHAVTIAELADAVGAHAVPSVVAIDIPIGLPSHGPRRADVLARERLGVRRFSVFATLVREAYEAETYEAALEAQQAATGKGMSRQAWGLRHKVLDVDGWLEHPQRIGVVVECHPELSFATMNGGAPVPYGKKTWSGQARRRELLASAGIVVPAEFGDAGTVPPDDVLDAAAAAWTARRVAEGRAESLPETPERFADRLAAITF
ncbi:DUF429 domain-containing protein [Phytoactinopolyspora halotolerans]|uniref:DUF429 domain-containing protein n=1 Tax=Phytoactinopolyspora halotolerans TaxID=1981512 RepID=UPI001C20960C|nr:DUF429 domain-containing protein [Phytoactinopolyspora halotolerans]